jgi:hypothetical protein
MVFIGVFCRPPDTQRFQFWLPFSTFYNADLSFPCHIWFLEGPIFSRKIIALKERVIHGARMFSQQRVWKPCSTYIFFSLSLAKVSQRKYIIAQATLQRAQRDIRTSILSFSCDKALCVKTKITIVFQRCSSLYPFFSFPMPHE